MSFRKFSADYVFDGYRLLKDAVIVMEEDGTVQQVVNIDDAGTDVHHFKGVLCPGLVNCHCHIELSHLKNVIPPHTGLVNFLVSVVQKRGFNPDAIQRSMEAAEQEMYKNGIVAVGDICNTTDAVKLKSNSGLYWHSFIEVLSFTDELADAQMKHYSNVLLEHEKVLFPRYKNVLSPHAPYTISPKTFQFINDQTQNQIISIHSQEHPAEDQLYIQGDGDYLKLFRIFGFKESPFPVTGKSSLQSYLPHFDNGQTLLLVHNSYITEEDILFANNYAETKGLTLLYCLCINANRYIEDKEPPIELLVKHQCKLVLGTDSYSSNWQLSIAKEIESILNTDFFRKQSYKDSVETVFTWATINGARALQIENVFGSFEQGKRPGVVLIENMFENELKGKNIVSKRIF